MDLVAVHLAVENQLFGRGQVAVGTTKKSAATIWPT
jgi:hypothetical protein